MGRYIQYLLICLAGLSVAHAAAAQARTEPPDADGPVVVRAGFMLYDINEIDESTETFEFEGALLLNWHDPREAFDPVETGMHERVYKGA